MLVSELNGFFYQRDLPNAFWTYNRLKNASHMFVTSYQYYDGSEWNVKNDVIYKFLNDEFIHKSYTEYNNRTMTKSYEDVLLPDLLKKLILNAKLSKEGLDDFIKGYNSIRNLGILPRTWWKMNKRESKSFITSFVKGYNNPMDITDDNIQKVLNLKYGKKYDIKDLEKLKKEDF